MSPVSDEVVLPVAMMAWGGVGRVTLGTLPHGKQGKRRGRGRQHGERG
jgi:hypothetical protein